MTVRFIPVIAVLVALLSGCFSDCPHKAGADGYESIREGLVPNNSAAVKRFSDYSVDEQITIFLYARDCRDDPRFRPMLILNGEKKIVGILQRIKDEKKVWDKAELAGVLIAINTRCRCISKDSEVVKTLEQVIEQLDADPNIPPDYTYKRIFKEKMETLKHQLEDKVS